MHDTRGGDIDGVSSHLLNTSLCTLAQQLHGSCSIRALALVWLLGSCVAVLPLGSSMLVSLMVPIVMAMVVLLTVVVLVVIMRASRLKFLAHASNSCSWFGCSCISLGMREPQAGASLLEGVSGGTSSGCCTRSNTSLVCFCKLSWLLFSMCCFAAQALRRA